jgi:hypothetical protein
MHYMKGDECAKNNQYIGYQRGYAEGFKDGQQHPDEAQP